MRNLMAALLMIFSSATAVAVSTECEVVDTFKIVSAFRCEHAKGTLYHANGSLAGKPGGTWYYSKGNLAGKSGQNWYASDGTKIGRLEDLSEIEQLRIVLHRLLD